MDGNFKRQHQRSLTIVKFYYILNQKHVKQEFLGTNPVQQCEKHKTK